MSTLHAVIMAGGSGTRFWPASRQARPKQLLPLLGGKLLIQAAIERLDGLCEPDHVWIVTNQKQRRTLGRLLLDFPIEQVLVEPEARDTAPCVAFATATIAAADPDATVVVLPADHVIEPVAEFQRMVRRAVEIAADGETLVTFGVQPTSPATGYGYVERGEALDDRQPRAFAVRGFREKPDLATARDFVARGTFLWNSGIFVWRLSAIRRAMREVAPELGAAAEQMLEALQKGQQKAVVRAFKQAPKTSIDYAVMERAPKAAIVEATARWDDVGSFTALQAVGQVDAAGNVAVLANEAASVVLEGRQNVVYGEGKRTIALFGVDDLVVAAVGDAVLVCSKERAGELKTLVEHLRTTGRTDLL